MGTIMAVGHDIYEWMHVLNKRPAALYNIKEIRSLLILTTFNNSMKLGSIYPHTTILRVNGMRFSTIEI